MMYALRVIMITMIFGFGLLGFGTFAVAEEGEIQAVAPWEGEGHAFPIGNDRLYMVAVYSGTIFVDKGEGMLHSASIVCPATVEMDLITGKKIRPRPLHHYESRWRSRLCRLYVYGGSHGARGTVYLRR